MGEGGGGWCSEETRQGLIVMLTMYPGSSEFDQRVGRGRGEDISSQSDNGSLGDVDGGRL